MMVVAAMTLGGAAHVTWHATCAADLSSRAQGGSLAIARMLPSVQVFKGLDASFAIEHARYKRSLHAARWLGGEGRRFASWCNAPAGQIVACESCWLEPRCWLGSLLAGRRPVKGRQTLT